MQLERVVIDGRDFVPEDPTLEEELEQLRLRVADAEGDLADREARLQVIHQAVSGFEARPVVIPPGRSWWHRAIAGFWVLAAGVVVGAAAASWNPDTPTVVETVTVEEPAPKPFTYTPQQFTWGGVEGAYTYRVGFYKAGRVVHEMNVPGPSATASLPPGEYLWVVWSVTRAGVQSDRAIVQSELVVE